MDRHPAGPLERSVTRRNPTWKLDGHTVETEYDIGVPGWFYTIKGWGQRFGAFGDENEAMRDAVKRIAELPKPIAVLGDKDPIENDGGIIYQHPDGGYSMRYFNTYSDEDRVAVYDFGIDDPKGLTWVDWGAVAQSHGLSQSELEDMLAPDADIVTRGHAYIDAAGHYGFGNLSEPDDMTMEEATERWGHEVDAAHEAWARRPRDPRLPNPSAIKERLLAY
jgi:hypothetical protein